MKVQTPHTTDQFCVMIFILFLIIIQMNHTEEAQSADIF